MQQTIRIFSKIALAAVVAFSSATSIVLTQAANPAPSGAANDTLLNGASLPASADWAPYHHRGRYAWHGRYWEHRRWHPGYWGPAHRWHAGFWIYF